MKLPSSFPRQPLHLPGLRPVLPGWTVPVDQETEDRPRKHDWGGNQFEPHKAGGYPCRIKPEAAAPSSTRRITARSKTEIRLRRRARRMRGFPLRTWPTSMEVAAVHEPRLLGSAGAMLANRNFVADDGQFFVIYA